MQRRDIFKLFAAAWGVALTRPLQAALGDVTAPPDLDEETMKRMQEKIDHFNDDFPDDIYLKGDRIKLMKQVQARLNRCQDVIGYARFNLIGFDELLKAAADHSQVGVFSKEEMDFIDEIFFFDARKYGFYGVKVTEQLTARVDDKNVIKINGTGHYIYKGRPQALYQEITRDIGSEIVLTSGIRSVVKQLHLFLTKAVSCDGNLSRASRSLAPPGHSFHGISDFDVGKNGFGYRNFTDQFEKTDVFKRLIDLGYVDIRYTRTNSFGVRFEPWHIKVG